MSNINTNDNEEYVFNNNYLKIAYDNAEDLLIPSDIISDFIEQSIDEINNGSSFEEVLFDAVTSGYREAIIQLDILYKQITDKKNAE